MSRDAQAQASQNAQMGQQFATQANQNATSEGNWLQPTLQNQYANPQGFGQGFLDSSKAEAGQIAGSKAATAKNNLELTAGRTGNSAGFAPAEDQAMRDSQSGLSNSILGIDTANAVEKTGQQAQALSGMEGMRGQDLNAETGNLGQSTNAVNSEVNAGNSGWFQNYLAYMGAMSKAATAGAAGGG